MTPDQPISNRIPADGVPPSSANPSADEIACPECGLFLAREEMENHLRHSHGLYTFKGHARTSTETEMAALEALGGPRPDPEAWRILQELVRRDSRENAEEILATKVTQALRRAPHKKRARSISFAASAIAKGVNPSRLIPWLARLPNVTAHRLALAILARIGGRMPAADLRSYLSLFSHRKLPTREAVSAAARLLTFLDKNEADMATVCEALAAGRRRRRAIARLTLLENKLGSSAALSAVRKRLLNKGNIRCPKCQVKLNRGEMFGHLWQEHELVLYGDKARKPWNLLELWITEHGAEDDGAFLERCRQVVRTFDPAEGPLHLERLILGKGIDDVAARRFLMDQAQARHATLCPHCYALIPTPRQAAVYRVTLQHGRLGYLGYSVEVNEKGPLPRLLVRTPQKIIFKGFERPLRLTWFGVLLAILPLIGLALLFATGAIGIGTRVLWPTSILLITAWIIAWRARERLREIPKPGARALSYAWTRLAPALHDPEFKEEDAAFLSGLAILTSLGDRGVIPPAVLERCLAVTEKAVTNGSAGSVYLAALQRLAIAHRADRGVDPILEIAKQIGRSFEGPLSLAYAEELLDGWKADWLRKPALARLRVLVCDLAFEAGFEMAPLRHAVRAKPFLRDLIDTRRLVALAQLRLLWSLRPRQPWERHGKAALAFDLAAEDPTGALLGQYPDLLLVTQLDSTGYYTRLPAKHSDEELLLVCSRGICLQDQFIQKLPQTIDYKKRHHSGKSGYRVMVDELEFFFDRDPEPLIRQIERWCRYYFLEFRPLSEEVHKWQAPDSPARMRARGAVECGECQGWLLPRVGEIGVPLDDPDPISLEVVET